MYKRYIAPAVSYLFIYLFLPLVCFFTFSLSLSLYELLADELTFLPSYNPVTEKEAYLAHELRCHIFAILLSVFITSGIAAIYDNDRLEQVTTRTDGLFRIPAELPRYIRENLAADIIASATAQLPFLLLTLIRYPEKLIRLERIVSVYLEPHIVMAGKFGIPLSYLFITLAALSARLLSSPLALRRHRAVWLTSFVED